MRCWQCGAEPELVVETTTFGDPERTYAAGRWPPGDHEHAIAPPTPGELEDRSHRTLMRILAIAAE